MRSLVHLTARAKCARGRADENLLRIERALAAEAAADVGRDHAQPMPGQVERLGQRVADDAGDLRRRVQRERVAARLVFGEARARLDRHRGLAAHAEAAADPHRRRARSPRRHRRA